jgi:hypothetical protein
MTMQSEALKPASETNGPASSIPTDAQLRQVQANVTARQPVEPKRLSESFRKMTRQLHAVSDERLEAEQTARRNRVRAEAWARADVPGRHAPCRDWQPGPWMDAFQRLCRLEGAGCLLALLGPRGTGKTQMAVELIRHHCATSDHPSALYVRAMDVFLDVKATYGTDRQEREAIGRFLRPSLLVIDEAQERGDTAWEDRLLTYIIDVRYAERLDTLLLSNLTEQDFKAAIGSSIYSRLVETGGVIECCWPSFRRPQQQESKA